MINTLWDKDQVFVVLPYAGRPTERYNIIKEECTKIGLNAESAHDFLGSVQPPDEIRRRILRAEFIICDLTSRTPEIYYQLGYAQGVGNSAQDIFLITETGSESSSRVVNVNAEPFDSSEDLRIILRTKFFNMVTIRRLQEPPPPDRVFFGYSGAATHTVNELIVYFNALGNR